MNEAGSPFPEDPWNPESHSWRTGQSDPPSETKADADRSEFKHHIPSGLGFRGPLLSTHRSGILAEARTQAEAPPFLETSQSLCTEVLSFPPLPSRPLPSRPLLPWPHTEALPSRPLPQGCQGRLPSLHCLWLTHLETLPRTQAFREQPLGCLHK